MTTRAHEVIAGLIALVCLIGIVSLAVLAQPIPDVLILLAISAGGWYFGSTVRRNGPAA